jgi:ADP-heptose:LPS heptosyltransferase
MGDIVLTSPVIRRLAQQLEGNTEIHFLTKKAFAPLLENNPFIHQIHVIEKSVQEVLPDLIALDFDYVVDLHNNIRSRVVKRRLGRLNFTFNKLNVQKWLLVNLGINRMPDVHVVDRYLNTVSAFGTSDDGKGLDYFLPHELTIRNLNLPVDFVAVAVGAAHVGKRMQPSLIIDFCKQINLPVVLLGGKEDVDAGAEIASNCAQAIDLTGKLTIHQSAAVIREARVVVSGDTGLMHIASAFKKKIVSVWGCTSPVLGMAPYRPHKDSIIIEPHGRHRRPCSKLGNKCKYGNDNRCIDAVSASEIAQAIEKLWVQ